MAQMHLPLPDGLSSWAESQATQGGYADPADYVRDVVRREREYQDKRARLEAALDEELPSPIVDTTIDEIIARGRARHGMG